jgi:putative endonuclease
MMGSGRAETGRKGEDLALEYLRGRGMRLVARNWRCSHKELDLVMDDGFFLRVVEVRSLTFPNLQLPAESVDKQKRMRVLWAARKFAAMNSVQKEIVFDIVSVVFRIDGRGDEKAEILYFPDAFSPQW